MFSDLRYAIRMLMKNPGFTVVAVFSLALGIGANTALFSEVNAVLLRTLPVKEPSRLVLFEWQAGSGFRTNGGMGSFHPATAGMRSASMFCRGVVDKMRQARANATDDPLSDFFAFAPIFGLTAIANDQAESISGQFVSGGYYTGLGVQPILGRTITDSDDDPGAVPVVVLSHDYWQVRFGARSDVVGQQIKLNQIAFTIIGVTPPAFTGTLQVDSRPAVMVPLALEPLLGERSGMGGADRPDLWWINLMARLKPGATLEQARDSLNGPFQAMALELMPPPRRDDEPARLEPKDYPRLVARTGSRGLTESRESYSTTIYGLFAVVALVLMIACTNVANLLLVRASLRGPEISVRLALGAGRWRLIRQLLTESILLASLGGALGLLVAFWGNSALLALAQDDTSFLPKESAIGLSWRVLAFTLATSLVTGILFGLAPALRATKMDLATAIKHGHRAASGAVSRLSKGLVVLQVALSLLMLVGAGLFIRTLSNLERVNLGFNDENLLLFSLNPGQQGYKGERLMQFYQQLFAHLDNLPGVRACTFSRIPLIARSGWSNDVLLPGETERTTGHHSTNRQAARENYFTAMEIPLLRGRIFTEQDDQRGPKVAIVNQAFSRAFFPNNDALGKRISVRNAELEIVGVVADSQYNSQRNAIQPLLYTPWRQEGDAIGCMYFALRTMDEPTALAPAVRQAVRELDSGLPVMELITQKARSQQTLGQERLYARLLGFFGAVAVTLAAIGLSGVLAYSVAQRTKEIGVRMALGAQHSDVLRLVLRQGMILAGTGICIGLAGAAATTHLFRSLLYGVSPLDPVSFLAIPAMLMGVSAIASWLPARRASKVDPMVALRSE